MNMKKQMKILIIIGIANVLLFLLSNYKAFATNIKDGEIEISQNYLEYLELTYEEKENVIAPPMYDIVKSNIQIKNPFKISKKMKTSLQTRFSLKDIIPENMVVKNQHSTENCWAFASLATLESHLALQDYKSGRIPVVYDFSESHMDYATTRVFLNGEINEFGFNRVAGKRGVNGMPIAYLTNGLGAVAEEDMPFRTDLELIDISEIQNKDVITQVNNIVTFPSYSITDNTTQIKLEMKEHIMEFGAIRANINSNINDGGAVYCSDSTIYKIDHSVAIIGWDDEYSIENFNEYDRPANSGAWIAKNSTGKEIGDEGFIYISYEDVNVYKYLIGILDAQTEMTYENIYQYDELGGYLKYQKKDTNKIYLATEFDKKTNEKEYLTHISIRASEDYKCRVFINPNGTSKDINDLQQVELKTGETESFDAGYHTIEFANPIKIGEKFVVVLEIEGNQENLISILVEANFGEFFTDSKYDDAPNHVYDTVVISDGKCFIASEEEANKNEWTDTSKVYEISEKKLPNFDTTIKAFTTSKILESIEIIKSPNKTTYVIGQNFDSAGMVMKGNYANGDSIEITDYSIIDGENLALNQKEVTIIYQNKTIKQPINVVENSVENIVVKAEPVKKEYWAGDDFDSEGMIIEAIFTDGTINEVTGYIIQNGTTLKNGQTSVTIEYNGKFTIQKVVVKNNSIEKLEVKSNANKLKYVVGQNFNSDGLVLKATYRNGYEKEVTNLDYIIKDGQNLQETQSTITIEFEGLTVTQTITVVAKTVVSIKVEIKPTKIEYIQGEKELDLSGGTIKIFYNDETEEEISMTATEIIVGKFDSKNPGVKTIELTYQDKTTEFEIEVKELTKPTNSNFENIQVKAKNVKGYYFTNKNTKEYVVLDVELSNIIKATENENMEYYYYLSANPNESNISSWIKIDNAKLIGATLESQILFEINSADIVNYEELAKENNLYLYVKEISTKNNMKAEVITDALSINIENIKIEEYIDGKKKTEIKTEISTDNTIASESIPKAGKSILILLLAIVICVLGRILYLKYKDIEI